MLEHRQHDTFVARWREGYEVVYAVRERRAESWPKRLSYTIFYRLLQRISHIAVPVDSGDFSLMDRRVIDVIVGSFVRAGQVFAFVSIARPLPAKYVVCEPATSPETSRTAPATV